MRTIVVISDLQVPYQDKRAVKVLSEFIKSWQPDEVACIGDVLDAPQISRWNKGMEGEFTRDLSKDRDEAVKVLESLRVGRLCRSNHDDRIETYVRKYAPGLGDLPELFIERFLRLDDLGIEFHRTPGEVAPGWLLLHGDEGSLLQTPGSTALSLAKKTGKSVVCGHTHRLGLQHHSEGYGGRLTRTLYGFEVGNLMNMKQATYLKYGAANWQQGFGVLYVEGNKVTPVPVVVERDGTFVFEGRRWS